MMGMRLGWIVVVVFLMAAIRPTDSSPSFVLINGETLQAREGSGDREEIQRGSLWDDAENSWKNFYSRVQMEWERQMWVAGVAEVERYLTPDEFL